MNEDLIVGVDYKLWREGAYLGIATFTDDPNNGLCFLRAVVTKSGELAHEVYIADKWEMNKPKYYSDVFEEKGFQFVEHSKPHDIWIKDDEKILHCMPCMRFLHYKAGKVIKSMRGYPHQIKAYVKAL